VVLLLAVSRVLPPASSPGLVLLPGCFLSMLPGLTVAACQVSSVAVLLVCLVPTEVWKGWVRLPAPPPSSSLPIPLPPLPSTHPLPVAGSPLPGLLVPPPVLHLHRGMSRPCPCLWRAGDHFPNFPNHVSHLPHVSCGCLSSLSPPAGTQILSSLPTALSLFSIAPSPSLPPTVPFFFRVSPCFLLFTFHTVALFHLPLLPFPISCEPVHFLLLLLFLLPLETLLLRLLPPDCLLQLLALLPGCIFLHLRCFSPLQLRAQLDNRRLCHHPVESRSRCP